MFRGGCGAFFRHGDDDGGGVVVDVDGLIGVAIGVDGVCDFVGGRHGAGWIGDVFIGDVGGSIDAEDVVALGNEEEMELAVGAFEFAGLHFALVAGV